MSEPTMAVQVPKAAEQVAAQLRRQIIMGERVEGEMLPTELELTRELGVSRPTLRQALRVLEMELLVTVHRGRYGGIRVNRPSAGVAGRYLGNVLLFQGTTLDDVHAARRLIEPAAVAALVGTITPDQIGELRALITAARGNTDVTRTRALGERFHAALVGMTGNAAMTLFAQLVQNLISAHTDRYEQHRRRVGAPSRAEELLDAHDHLVDLLEAGAAREAARSWREHIDGVHAVLRTTVDSTVVLDLEL
jgi:GntR family transcriptional repressor for pyruvate dehydrogenase complex